MLSGAADESSTDEIAEILTSFRSKGVRLWCDNGRLRYRAPRGVLSEKELAKLQTLSRQIVAMLERGGEPLTTCTEVGPGPQLDHAPLTFSQLARWHTYQNGERRPMRQVASATRIRGRLDASALRAGLALVVSRHEALRTRIVVVNGIPVQQIDPVGTCALLQTDLSALHPDERDREVDRLIEQTILAPIDFARGGLFSAHLAKLGQDHYVLTVAMEHMISDGCSLNIVVRGLFAAYAQVLRGHPMHMPLVAQQFADYARWQQATACSWSARHRSYWEARVGRCGRLRFPEDPTLSHIATGWGIARLRIAPALKAQLLQWCRLRQTTLALAIFAAYSALVLRWCNAREAVIQYEADGRISSAIENTIGFFASALYLHVSLQKEDTFSSLLSRITCEYCEAYEHADFSRFEAQLPRPEFTRNTTFNWVPHAATIAVPELDGSPDALRCSTVPLAERMLDRLHLDQEPGVLFFDTGSEIAGALHFPRARFAATTMDRFGENLLTFITTLLERPEQRVCDMTLGLVRSGFGNDLQNFHD